MTGKIRPRTLFLISGIWFSIALLWCLSLGWLGKLEHQAWGVVTVVVFLFYVLLMLGWLVPLVLAFIRLVSPSLIHGKHVR